MKLSIIILSYNTHDLLKNCLTSIKALQDKIKYEVIVSDNGSIDQSVAMVKSEFPWVKVLENKANLGFAAGNNKARAVVKGEYILFLNSDTEVRDKALEETVNYLENNPQVGALTCKIVLPNGNLDRDARRSFPTPWVAFTHFSFLDRVFPKSKIFARYWYGYKSADQVHEVDVLQGAFFLTRKSILDKVDWYDESYFLDGEDIDLSWKIKQLGYKIIYYPKVSTLHIKKASKRKSRSRSVTQGVRSMEFFYKKHLWNKYPIYINWLVMLGIQSIKLLRLIKLYLPL